MPAFVAAVKQDPDPSMKVRSQAIVELANLGPAARKALPQLLEFARTDASFVRDQAVAAAVRIDPDDADVRKAVLDIVTNYRPNQVPVLVLAALAEQGPAAAWAAGPAAEAIKKMPAPFRFNSLGPLAKFAGDSKEAADVMRE